MNAKKVVKGLKALAERLERGEAIEAIRVKRYETPDGPMHIREKIVLKGRKK